MPPGQHSRLGGSKAKRWRNCPGSVTLEDGLPDTSGPNAELGTGAHNLAEMCLNEGTLPADHLGETITGKQEEHYIDENMAEAVTEYVEFCRDLVDGEEECEVFVERRFDLKKLNPPEPMFGTADFVVWFPTLGILHVVDYKHGTGVYVEAEENDQLLMYMGGAMLSLGVVPKQVVGTIVQPRHHAYAGPRQWVLDTQEMAQRFQALLQDARRASEDDGTSLEPGDWCKFCKAKPHCPAHMDLAVVTTQMAFEVLEPEEEKKLPAPGRLTEEQLLAILEVADHITDWLAAVRQHAHEKVEAGEEIPGWALAAKRATRRWVNEEAVKAWLAKKRVPQKEYLVKKLGSPAHMEKVAKARGFSLPEELFNKESSGTRLVRADSATPKVEPPVYRFFQPETNV